LEAPSCLLGSFFDFLPSLDCVFGFLDSLLPFFSFDITTSSSKFFVTQLIIEATNMMRKGQVEGIEKGNVRAQVEFVSQIFGLVAYLD
jgi:hypothetical protein